MKHHKKKKKLQLFAAKLTEKLLNPCNAKEYYQSFIRQNDTKLVKESKIITEEPKTFGNSNIVDITLVIIEHSKKLINYRQIIQDYKTY